MQQHGLEHYHKRKVLLGKHPFIDTRFTRFVDTIIYPVGILGIAMALPQVYDVWILKEVAGVSLLTFGSWAVLQLVWITYGYIHKHRLIFYIHTGWLVVHLSIVLGVVVHS